MSALNEGQAAGKPKGMSGTVNQSYEGDQSQRVSARSGTPYTSKNGNPAGFQRQASHGEKMGIVLSENGLNMSDPDSNGNGVIFDGVTRATGYRTNPQPPLLDSPVPDGSQKPVQDGPIVLANLRSGIGKTWGPNDGPGDNFQTMGGVMTRETVGSSEPSTPETDLIRDDDRV